MVHEIPLEINTFSDKVREILLSSGRSTKCLFHDEASGQEEDLSSDFLECVSNICKL